MSVNQSRVDLGVVYTPDVASVILPFDCTMNRQQVELVKRAQIVALHDIGMSNNAIAEQLAVSRTTVVKWIRRQEETGILTDLGKYEHIICEM